MATSLQRLSSSDPSAHDLRLLYQLYEDAQRSRIAHGERLRALLQGRSFDGLGSIVGDPDSLLKAIAGGDTVGAPRVLEKAYWRASQDESDAAAALRVEIETHPAWEWLSQQRGVGELLAARLLSRLDIARAKTPSAFWAYCGLATIPGAAYQCPKCKLEVGIPADYKLRDSHFARGSAVLCAGHLELIRGGATRVAPRRSAAGGRNSYDAHARKSCYLIGVSMLRCGSEYRSWYDAERERLAADHPGWTAKRSHLAALRKMEKAFLRELWLAWRKAVDLPLVRAYHSRMQHRTA
ncbi:MAG TPA: transposase [Gemmatimonadaceae bacterium]|nr:transposase [Gemmatimonadaceae bacterium]